MGTRLFVWAAVLGCVTSASAESRRQYLQWQTRIDLDGDGRPEQVQLQKVGEEQSGGFRLSVGNQSVMSSLSYTAIGFWVVNIDKHDRFREICVHTDGPSDDFGNQIFSFEGHTLRKIGNFEGVSFRGDGQVEASRRLNVWWSTETWIFGSRRLLKRKTAAFYPVNLPATTRVLTPLFDFSLRRRRAMLAANRKITVVKSSPRYDRYFFRTTTGEAGWVSARVFEENLIYDFPQPD